jgi:hypothetical protein
VLAKATAPKLTLRVGWKVEVVGSEGVAYCRGGCGTVGASTWSDTRSFQTELLIFGGAGIVVDEVGGTRAVGVGNGFDPGTGGGCVDDDLVVDGRYGNVDPKTGFWGDDGDRLSDGRGDDVGIAGNGAVFDRRTEAPSCTRSPPEPLATERSPRCRSRLGPDAVFPLSMNFLNSYLSRMNFSISLSRSDSSMFTGGGFRRTFGL